MARRSYTAEFKRGGGRLGAKAGVFRRGAGRQRGINPNVLAHWQANFKSGQWVEKDSEELRSAQAKELERLKRENASLKMDLEILKKAVAYFAKESK